MQNRWNRIGSLAFSGLLTVALLPVASSTLQAQRPTRSSSGVEKSLAGVRILQSYKSVLDRFGAPTRIFQKGEVVDFIFAEDARGLLTGGVSGYGEATNAGGSSTLASTGGARGGGGMMGMGGGMPGMGGPPNMGAMMRGMGNPMAGGMPGGGGPPNMGAMMRGMGNPMAGSGMPGMGNPMAGSGMPGFAGRRGGGDDDGGAPAAPGGMMGGAGGNAAKGNTFGDAGGFIWSYLDPKSERATTFLFNKDGRVEVIIELGRFRSSVTSKGLSIGSALQDVYKSYGWPDSTRIEGKHTVMVYLQKHHLEVFMANNKVVGLIVTLRENQIVSLIGGKEVGGAAGGGRGAMGGSGGMMGGGMPRMAGGPPSIGGRMMPGRGAIGGGGGGGKFGGMKGE